MNNGAAFNTVAMNIAMLCGPVIGGLLYKAFGPQGAYLAIASLYLASGMVAVASGSTAPQAAARRSRCCAR